MQKLFRSLVDLVTYKEPASTEDFELLEDASEAALQEEETKKVIEKTALHKNGKGTPGREKYSINKNSHVEEGKYSAGTISTSLKENIDTLKKEFKMPANKDIFIREFKINDWLGAAIGYINGMVDKNMINDFVLRPLMSSDRFWNSEKPCTLDYILNSVLTVNTVIETDNFTADVIPEILNGYTVLFIDGFTKCILIDSRGYEKRSVEKPSTETVIRGSQEGFTENLRTNITLVRRIVRNKDLVSEIFTVKSSNNLTCAVMYVDGITNPRLIGEVKRRLKSINADIISSDGILEQLIEDRPFSFFPQVLSTERPDRAAAFLLGGQVVIASEGSPFMSAVPVTLFYLYQTSEDTNLRWQFSTVVRFVRILGILSSVLLPGFYIALTLYHREMIPTDLLASIARSKEDIPFPTLIEVLIMEISFEIIREAGIRVPGVIGPTLGIIGALILGQAAVAADLVSPVLIIIVAVTGLGNFAIPNYSFSTSMRILRFIFIFMGSIAGFYGIAACMSILGGSVCSLKSFGVPFLAPVAPTTKKNTDIFIRKPIWKQNKRSDYLNTLAVNKKSEGPIGWRTRDKERKK